VERARNHEVVHEASGRRLAFGALVPAAAKLSVPKAEELQFKPKTAWRMVGKDTSTYDQKDIVTGKAQFGLDVYRDGMVYASIEHPPVLGGTAKNVDNKAALAVKGVQQTVTLDTFKPPHLFQPLGGVAVIADNTWSALKGRRALKVEWNDGAHGAFESEAFKHSRCWPR
jgi:isoquinoline 1-oxidoreductase beta subunit